MVALGIDRIGEYRSLFQGKRLGLITNYSGVTSDLRDDLTAFAEAGYNVTRLFTPEHGMYGARDGAGVGDGLHPVFHIPMVSLYGSKLRPEAEDLADLDMLVYDIQDVGMRYYTYIYTMAGCMRSAAEARLPMTVLDRPDMLGDALGGNRILPRYDSFVGAHRLLTRYGMTPGETARYFKAEMGLDLELTVVPMKGYRPDMTWPETGQIWNIPSPSIHTFNSALCYVGGCFFEATDISEGRGTAEPFQIYGAPFVDMRALVSKLREVIRCDGLAMRERAFTPFWSKYAGEVCFGVEFIPLSPRLDFMYPALILMKTLRDMYPSHMAAPGGDGGLRLARLSGDDSVRRYLDGSLTLEALQDDWRGQTEAFAREIEEFKLYSATGR